MKILLLLAATFLAIGSAFAPQSHLYWYRSGDSHFTLTWPVQPRWHYSIQTTTGTNTIHKLNSTVFEMDACFYGSASITLQCTGTMHLYRLVSSTNSALICR